MHICFKLYVIGKTNTYKQADLWTDINGKVKVIVILSKRIFSSSKLLHVQVQYVFNESAKYQNLSTNSLSQDDFTIHALSQLQHLRAYNTQ